MIIKKFQGKSENEAVETAKKELGNNVVIMNVRSVKRKGVFSFLKPQLTEVTVALEEESEQRIPAPVKKEEPKQEMKRSLVDAIASEEAVRAENSAIEEKLDNLHFQKKTKQLFSGEQN